MKTISTNTLIIGRKVMLLLLFVLSASVAFGQSDLKGATKIKAVYALMQQHLRKNSHITIQ